LEVDSLFFCSGRQAGIRDQGRSRSHIAIDFDSRDKTDDTPGRRISPSAKFKIAWRIAQGA
jgi:hypothetical protein